MSEWIKSVTQWSKEIESMVDFHSILIALIISWNIVISFYLFIENKIKREK